MTTETLLANMANPIIQYRVFETNELFVEWQKEVEPIVCNVSPISNAAKMSLDVTKDKWKLDYPATYGVFVTYTMP